LSDMYDRRKVIIIVTFAAAFFALCAIFASGTMFYDGMLGSNKFWFYIFLILFSFCSLPMFSLILAHTNDFIPKEKFVAQVLVYSLHLEWAQWVGRFYVLFLWALLGLMVFLFS